MKSVERRAWSVERKNRLPNANRYPLNAIVVSLLLLSVFTTSLPAAGQPIETVFPPSGFKGWVMEGTVKRYTAENLYTYINGEAELYMPYGFETLGSALYVKTDNPDTSIAADVYRMRSLLDAFGIYAYYRDPDADDARTGSEGFIDDAQVMFYKDRYFVRISASGTVNPERSVLDGLAKAIAGMIPGESVRPKELELLKVPGIIPRTEKYIAQSLMGYKFFQKGLMAEATIDGKPAKVFIVLDESEQDSGNTLNNYAGYLKERGVKPEAGRSKDGATLIAQDPLYKGVMVRQAGPYFIGVAGIGDPMNATGLIERLQARISGVPSSK